MLVIIIKSYEYDLKGFFKLLINRCINKINGVIVEVISGFTNDIEKMLMLIK